MKILREKGGALVERETWTMAPALLPGDVVLDTFTPRRLDDVKLPLTVKRHEAGKHYVWVFFEETEQGLVLTMTSRVLVKRVVEVSG